MSDCVFCALVAGEREASVVYEDDRLLGFMDLHPVNPGHVLLVPKGTRRRWRTSTRRPAHTSSGSRCGCSRRSARSGVRCEGINLFVADGEAAFQDVFHFHLHVIPRFEGDPFKIEADWKEAPRSELDRAATGIRTSYEELWG